jgi:FAD/FMN-containing dehydrogenase
MVTLTPAHKSAIERALSPDRVRFDLATRSVLSRDDGIPPPSLWPLSGRTVAEGVVWPESEHEIVDLVRIACADGIPLVPRGGGTAATGGAVPANGGLVVDLSRLSGLSELDAGGAGATDQPVVDVRAGTLWTSFGTALAPHGLAPRLYPTSAPWSTVGGWLAQGGAGIGSFAFGWLDQNVLSVRLVDGEGRVYRLSGIDLDGISEAQGTTGIITEVRLRVRSASPIHTTAIAFPEATSLADALHLATLRELPCWSISFVDPNGARSINVARDAAGHPERLPTDAFVALFACREADRAVAELGLVPIARETEGRWLPVELARREWAERFRPVRGLRAGQTTAPAEVVVPTAALGAALSELQRLIPRGLSLEGAVVRGGKTVLRAYLDPDTPGAGAGLRLGFALQVMALATRHGGRGLSTGRYFGPQAKAILGPQRVELIREMRAWLDPAGIYNPGKVVFDNRGLGLAVQLAARVPRGTAST